MDDSEYENDKERYQELVDRILHLQYILADKRYYEEEEASIEEDIISIGNEISSLQEKQKFW